MDSSVAAFLMQQAGYDCVGATMLLHEGGALADKTTDITDARNVCDRLNIPHYVYDFSDTFTEQVIDRFVAEYLCGLTPNPCIACNRFLKFDRLYHVAQELGCDCMVTGHYARVAFDEDSGCYVLKTAVDAHKDQSYVLYGLTQELLAFTRLPLGELTKEQVRALAVEAGFATAGKGESQDICFIPEGDYAAFIRKYVEKEAAVAGALDAELCPDALSPDALSPDALSPGKIVDTEGTVLGRHEGIVNYTIGQRKGIGIAAAEPLYVKALDVATKTVVVAPRSELGTTTALLADVNVVSCASLSELSLPIRAYARHRYHCTPRLVTVEVLNEHALPNEQALVPEQGLAEEKELAKEQGLAPEQALVEEKELAEEQASRHSSAEIKIIYDEPVVDLACGQALVLYDPDTQSTVLAGGTII